MLAKAFPLLATVVLLFWMGFFTLASPPLLVLKHDTPKDANFIRNLFNTYYVVLMTMATIGAAICVYLEKTEVAYAMGGLVIFVFAVRLLFISRMDRLRGVGLVGDSGAVRKFRSLHMAGIALNVVQLGTVAWGMTRLAPV